jgi:hypothetical protein
MKFRFLQSFLSRSLFLNASITSILSCSGAVSIVASLAMSYTLESQAMPLQPMSEDTTQQSGEDEQPRETSVSSLQSVSFDHELVELRRVRQASEDGEELQSLLGCDQAEIRYDSKLHTQKF